jgi:hypothetical protein
MRTLLVSSLVLLAAVAAADAKELVREISWSQLKKDCKLAAGDVVQDKKLGLDVLKVENKEAAPKTINVLDLEQPGIKSIHYAIEGRVRYENVQKGENLNSQIPTVGYLELWNWFSDGGMYFSRTLGDSSPMQCLDGSSDWRPFSLPFFSNEKTGPPTRIVVNVLLPSRGTVYLSPLRINQYKPGEDPFANAGAWWNDQAAAWIGGIGGSVIGLLGALIGTLAGLGRAQTFVLTLSKGLLVLGLGFVLSGLVAVVLGQPYGVYYPLLLGGVILTLVIGLNLPGLRRRYEQIELRRMEAMDVGQR